MKFLIKSTVKTVTIEKYESVIEATSSDEAKTIFAGGMERSSYALYHDRMISDHKIFVDETEEEVIDSIEEWNVSP